jgi:hypothetical protein
VIEGVLPVLETTVHVPVPDPIGLPAKVADVVEAKQIAWSGPAFAVVGAEATETIVAALVAVTGDTHVPLEVTTTLIWSLSVKIPVKLAPVAPPRLKNEAAPLVLNCHW